MAKKQKTSGTQGKGKGKGGTPTQSTSKTITNSFLKGMLKDTDASYFSKDNWFHAINAVNNSVDGDVGVIGNEPANLRCAKIPYAIIGAIHLYGDTWSIFSTNNVHSEIGLFDDSKCEYTHLVNDPCLNFSQNNLIVGAAKENFDCSWQVYWDDGLNPSRTLNLDNIPYAQVDNTPLGASCISYTDELPIRLDCELIRLAPLIDVPCVTLRKADAGGLLENGSYQVFIAYTVNEKPVTDYIGISNIQSIWSHDDTQGSLDIMISNLDKEFDWITVAIKRRVKGQPLHNIIGTYSTETTIINIDYINAELPSILPKDLMRRNPAYEKSDGIFVVNDYLIRTQPTEQFDFNYQPLANEIKSYWTATSYDDNYYVNGGNKPTFLRDEQYTFFIRFIYNTGERSNSYHIPGRAPILATVGPNAGNPLSGELGLVNAPNSIDPGDQVFKATNTATSVPGDPFIAAQIGTISDDGGTVIDGGEMGYWQSTETYPASDPTRWASLCGLPIRHHKMPDETIGSAGSTLTNQTPPFEGSTINVLGVAFDNIAPPLYNDGTVIPNIVGYEIMVGSRAGHRSILAKGILKNMFMFRTDQDDLTNNEAGRGLMPNYPYNDLRTDPYLLKRNTGNGGMPWYSQLLGFGGGGAIEYNWKRGNNGGPADGDALDTISPDTFTFHAPDLNFSHLYLNPSEIRIYKTIEGPVTGRFKKSEDHPQHKLLKNRAATIAALIGVGYALQKMRGKRNYKVDTSRSSTTGESGDYVLGTGITLAPFPAVGTGTAAANVGASSGGIWWGMAADIGFNLAVDMASIVGGGSAARAVGIPIYQQVEHGSAALSAGHIGPQRSIEYEGSDFSSVPSAMSIAIGIITFLNHVAVGGDIIIDLILNLMSYQDYAVKYISHGYYKKEENYGGNQWRIGVDRSRYIKQAIHSFDGDNIVQNVLRPSTVVVRATNQWVSSFPSGDNTKFTIGAGPCAGDQDDDMSWWDPGRVVRSTAVANYGALKTPMDNQYGQLENIIQLNTQGCYNFKDQQKRDSFGLLVPIIPQDRFVTSTVYGGDSYIARYTEKAIMPFFYNFLLDGPNGLAFDYSKYANVPFPRYWMNTEKFRMDEYVKPITSVTFNWSSSEALPSGYYNLDTPDNGGYCGPDSLSGSFGFGTMSGTTTQSGGISGSTGVTGTGGVGAGTGLSNDIFTDPQNDFNLNNSDLGLDNRYTVVAFTTGQVSYILNCTTNSTDWQIQGNLPAITFSHPNATVLSEMGTAGTVNLTMAVNIGVSNHGWSTPLGQAYWNTSGGPNVISACSCNTAEDWIQWLTGTCDQNDQVIPPIFTGEGTISQVRGIFDWGQGIFVATTNAAVNNASATPQTYSNALIDFSNDAQAALIEDCGCWGINTCSATLQAGEFTVINGANINTNPDDMLVGGGPGDPDQLQDELDAAFDNSSFSDGGSYGTEGGGKSVGGLFILKTGFMYTHNCGINDFWVESSMNLAYRDWEDVPRKRHYDNNEYTDLVALFEAKIVEMDNYYTNDRSTAVDKFWGASWGEIQKRWYDPLIAETCYIKYPKRLLYSAPATGWIDKANLQSKNDHPQDFWRVYLSENFRDFKSKVTAVKTVNQTGALILFPTLSPRMFQGQDSLQLSSTKVTIGDGGLFGQAFQNVANSDVSHEYGSCESARSVLNTPSGLYFVSQAQGKIFIYNSKGIQAISDVGMKWWFNKFLPSQLLANFPDIEDCPQAIDNPLVGAGIQTVYDPNNDIVYFTKKDYVPKDEYVDCITYVPCEGFIYDSTNCGGNSSTYSCPSGFTLINNSGVWECVQYDFRPPFLASTMDYSYGLALGDGRRPNQISHVTNSKNGLDMPIVIDDPQLDGTPVDVTDITTWRNITAPWWLNTSGTNGIVNDLAIGSNLISVGTFAAAEFKINTPVPKVVHILMSANRKFILEKYDGAVWNDIINGVDAAWTMTQGAGAWHNNPGFTVLQSYTNADNAGASKAWIYKITLDVGCNFFRIKGWNDVLGPAFLGVAVIDVDNWQDIDNATQWNDLPKLFSSDVDDFMVYQSSSVFTCPPAYQQFTDGTDGSSVDCPICRIDSSEVECECEVSTTSGLPGTLVGNCPVWSATSNSWTIGSSYCMYTSYTNVLSENETFPIEVTDSHYFKDVSWTVSYDPKAKAWISFHDWHPELTFNSINHFLTSKTETTLIPQCPPGYTWNGQECCLSLHAEFPAEVVVSEFLSDVDFVPAIVNFLTETLDIAIVIDNSSSTAFDPSSLGTGFAGAPYPMAAQLEFVNEFINGMSVGMLGGPYAGQVEIGHGSWVDNGSPVIVQPLTDDPAVAQADLTTTNYDSSGGTCFDDAVQLANDILAAGSGATKLVIFITDATSESCSTSLSNFSNPSVTQCISIYANGDSSQLACTGSAWKTLIEDMITDTGLPSPANVPVCNENLFHLGAGISPGSPGAFDTVSATIIDNLLDCECDLVADPNGIWDQSGNNPPCAPLPAPNPWCISCNCPDGYVLIGDCDNSNHIPTCRKMLCECPSPYFNMDEVITHTGFCDDLLLYYNPDTGFGDPNYVNPDPLICVYDYEECVEANYEIGYFWKHNDRTDLFNNYYDEKYSWEVDIIETTGQQVTSLRSVEYQMEAYVYQNEGKDRFHDLDYNFDEAIIYNSEQVSGLLTLILEPKNNISLSILYPIVGANDIQILFSKEEQKYRFNQFWDVTNDRGEFSAAQNTIFLTDWDGYKRPLNPVNLNYNKPQTQRKKFRHYYNHILLRKSDEGLTTRKMLLILENTKLNMSFR